MKHTNMTFNVWKWSTKTSKTKHSLSLLRSLKIGAKSSNKIKLCGPDCMCWTYQRRPNVSQDKLSNWPLRQRVIQVLVSLSIQVSSVVSENYNTNLKIVQHQLTSGDTNTPTPQPDPHPSPNPPKNNNNKTVKRKEANKQTPQLILFQFLDCRVNSNSQWV